jgi:AcrR family transcriptional regulator
MSAAAAMPRPQPQPRRRLPTAERRRQIAEAALDIIATRGVHQLTTQEIAARVGVTDGSLFRHFESKQAIVAAAIDVFEALLVATFPEPSDDPLETLERFFVARVTFARRRPEIIGLVFNDRLTEAAGGEGARRVAAIVGRSLGFVGECLEAAQARGLVATDVPVQVLVWMVTGVLRGAARHPGAPPRRRPVPAAPAELWAAVEKLLRRTRVSRDRDRSRGAS